MRKIKFLAFILIILMILVVGCGESNRDKTNASSTDGAPSLPIESETADGPVLIINHVGQTRSQQYQVLDKIYGEIPLSFGENKLIEGFGYGTYKSESNTIDKAAIYSKVNQKVEFNVQGRMTDDCEIEITIVEDRLSGTKTSGFTYANAPRSGRPAEAGGESFEIIPGSEFDEGTHLIPFKSTLHEIKSKLDRYDWVWTFQILGFDDQEEVHGCTFTDD